MVTSSMYVANPCEEFKQYLPLWKRARVVTQGELAVKNFDKYLDVTTFSNLLIPFSPSMSLNQYNFYKAEAEFPGFTCQFLSTLVNSLLRKAPSITLPEDAPEGAIEWLRDSFGQNGKSFAAFMMNAVREEITTHNTWVFVDYPSVTEEDDVALKDYKPYPTLYPAEAVINWSTEEQKNGDIIVTRLITTGFTNEADPEDEFHPIEVQTIWVHEIVNGFYQVRVFKSIQENDSFELVDTIQNITVHGERLNKIPAWPMRGEVELSQPILTAFVDKEISIYNKISRRNHLLYGAATYTPIVKSDMNEDEFETIVSRGLGSWLLVGAEESIDVLKTPTEALSDMDRAIAAGIEEMAKLGIRILTPEVSQSGVALELRNASQISQLGALNTQLSMSMRQVLAFMINWRYGTDYTPSDIGFTLSPDFNNRPKGETWMRLATEWYQEGLIPRSAWLEMVKSNDILDTNYNDDKGQQEINEDDAIDKVIKEENERKY